MRYWIYLLLMTLTVLPVSAQKKQIAEAEDMIKKGKDLDKAETKMAELLKDSANRRNHKIWLTMIAAQRGQYDAGNEKLYLKQKYDTVSLFTLTRKLFSSMEQFDSIESLPDRRGRVRVRYRERHGEWLRTIRPNLYNGGAYFLKHRDYRRAFDFFAHYMESAAIQPLASAIGYVDSSDSTLSTISSCSGKRAELEFPFSTSEAPLSTSEALLPRAAYWSMYCGYQLKDSALTMRFAPLACRDTARLDYVGQYAAETYQRHGDTLNYVLTLQEGFRRSPLFPYYFPRLMEYYTLSGQLDSALVTADRALVADSTSRLFRFAKSTVLLNLGRYDETIALCQQLIAEDDSLADAYYNLGLAYFNQAVEVENSTLRPRRKRQQANKLYQQCRPWMEHYRQLAPDARDRWLPVLYTVYLNLNMGREFEEMEKLKAES